MTKLLGQWKALFAAFALGGGVGGCATATLTPKTVTAVQEVCIAERTTEETAFCLIGAYAIAVDELAAAREQGKLAPQVVSAVDPLIRETGERVAVAADAWGAVKGWRVEIEALQPLAEACIAAFKDEASIAQCIAGIGMKAATGEFNRLTRQAETDWATLRPKVEAVIRLNQKETAQ